MHQQLHRIGDRVDRLLNALWVAKGTDLMLTAGLPPMIRVDGTLAPVAGEGTLTADDTDALLAEVLTPNQQDAWRTEHEYDFSFSWREHARIRGNAFTQRGLTAVALRMIPREIPTPDELGLPAGAAGPVAAAPGTDPGDRPDRLGQVDHARLDGRPDQQQPGLPHHHHRGPDRVRPRPQDGRRSTSARSAPTPATSATRCGRRCARTPTCCSSARCATWSPSRSR